MNSFQVDINYMCVRGYSPFIDESKRLSGPDRVARALSFYSAAIPLFAKYKVHNLFVRFTFDEHGNFNLFVKFLIML